MKKKITLTLGVVAVVLLILCIVSRITQDNTAPVIKVSDVKLTYTEGGDYTGLFEGVTATDNKDGNLTDAVRIYDIAILADGKTAQVTYAVYDSSYNMAKATRTVAYQSHNSNTETGTEEEDDSSGDGTADVE
ncbi:MAG: HYR domain-containing protein [Lachnospiraceae bacterium]